MGTLTCSIASQTSKVVLSFIREKGIGVKEGDINQEGKGMRKEVHRSTLTFIPQEDNSIKQRNKDIQTESPDS